MNIGDYQKQALNTDQYPKNQDGNQSKGLSGIEAGKEELVPLLGLVGEVGSLLAEYKKLLRDGHIHQNFRDEVKEELGDILWYVANVAKKFELNLDEVACENLKKVKGRWIHPDSETRFYDHHLPEDQQLPRKFCYSFEQKTCEGKTLVSLRDLLNEGRQTGDPLMDNTFDNDGYRFHDVMHLAFASYLGWSPVLRKLLRGSNQLRHRRPECVDNAQDGGRAQVIEEAIVAAAYVYAEDHAFLEGAKTVGSELLRHIQSMTRKLEVGDRTEWEWNRALLCGFEVWRKLNENCGGRVVGDLTKPRMVFKSLKE